MIINCNQLGYKRALEMQLGPIFLNNQMLFSHKNKKVSIECKEQNCIDFLYSADIGVHETNHDENLKEGENKVIRSKLKFIIELDDNGKLVYKKGQML
ncbi:hypothetical protein [Wolbachia endosymbiont of Pentidionis agamae]|uniref:hypothetical protein n=1 Tax=Wolbachia endosymbiont of Pentidionis agamae TaxID=3110435 RepID=UPI002FD1A2AA